MIFLSKLLMKLKTKQKISIVFTYTKWILLKAGLFSVAASFNETKLTKLLDIFHRNLKQKNHKVTGKTFSNNEILILNWLILLMKFFYRHRKCLIFCTNSSFQGELKTKAKQALKNIHCLLIWRLCYKTFYVHN